MVKYVMQYLKQTKYYGLYYKSHFNIPRLIGYVDANFGGDFDDKKSYTGFFYTFGSTTIL